MGFSKEKFKSKRSRTFLKTISYLFLSRTTPLLTVSLASVVKQNEEEKVGENKAQFFLNLATSEILFVIFTNQPLTLEERA
jgi:hypothetical protein